MAEIRAFRAIRYDFTRLGGDLSTVIAPPYDVLDQGDKDTLLGRNERNIVAIDLPHIPPKSAGPPECYERSAQDLRSWLGDGTLVRESEPALYLYHQVFDHAGTVYTRRKFFAAVRLVPFSEGVVLPHEETFGGPKEDRLALTKATQCNLSPVFGLYTDPEDAVGQAFAGTLQRAPDAVATMDGVENRLWVVTDHDTVERVVKLMAPKRIFIADGHHRYGTGLNYRDYLSQASGSLPPDHPANYVLLVLGSMNDPGSLILPYNRVLVGSDASMARLTETWSAGCSATEASTADLVLYQGSDGSEQPLRYTNRTQLDQLEPEHGPAWRALDSAYLHRYLINELASDLSIEVRYVKSGDDARAMARQEKGVALLVKATPMEHLQAVSEAGELMPQKSTYFHPKLATGFVINPLSE